MKRTVLLLLCYLLAAMNRSYGQAPEVTISIPSTDICFNNPFVFTATLSNGAPSPVYQWQVNGANVGTNSPVYSVDFMQEGHVIRCMVTVSVGGSTTTITSNSITMTKTREIKPEVVVTASATSICAGAPVTFTAQNKSGNQSPSWHWTVNGAPVGTNDPVLTTNTLTNGDVVVCRMRVPHCGGGSTKDDSDPITITIKQATPSISIHAASTSVCRGMPAVFTAKATDGGSSPSWQWTVNGTAAGTNSSTFSYTPADGDEVLCLLYPDAASGCAAPGGVKSNAVKMKVTEGKPTTISIAASADDVCSSSPVSFTATVENGGTRQSFQWQVNGAKAGTNSPTYTAANWKDGDKIECILSADNTPCAVTSIITSNTITLQVRPAPVVVVQPATATVPAGTAVQLQTSITGAYASFTWTPATALVDPQILAPMTTPLQQSTTYRLSVVAENGCEQAGEAVIKVVTKLYMPDSFTPNGDGVNDIFRIPPGAGIDLEELAVYDRWGNKVFRTTDPAKGWDGRHKGQELNTGLYVYTLSGIDDKGKVLVKGTVLLVR